VGKKILIIDDDASITRTFERILQRQGYETETAKTGKEALQKTKINHYAVMLVDLCLPDINGIELLEELDRQNTKTVKIVITGSRFASADKVKNADAYMLKPVKPQELLTVIEQKIKERLS
jgi:two-component system response regulator ResD